MLASFPAGIVADKYRRDSVIKASLVVGFGSLIVTSCAVWSSNYYLLLSGTSMYGAFYGMAYTSGEALLSDSTPDGSRSKVLTRKQQVQSFGTCLGPLVAVAMFAGLGNEWTEEDCEWVILAGQGVCVPALISLCRLDDDRAGEGQEEEEEEEGEGDLLDVTGGEGAEGKEEEEEEEEGEGDDEEEVRNRRVPIIIATSDLISGLASGMSIRFFPIFFYDNLGLSPIVVQCLYIISPLIIIYLSRLARRISLSRGRCQTACLFKWVGITSMGFMLLSYDRNCSVYLTLFLYVLRTTTMNCTKALTSSQLYDCVKKSERGRFTFLESVNMFSWSGSAAVGGYLVGEIGIVGNFLVTGTMQLAATMPLLALFGLPSEGEQAERRRGSSGRRKRRRGSSAKGWREGEGRGLSEPLIKNP